MNILLIIAFVVVCFGFVVKQWEDDMKDFDKDDK